MKIPLDLDSVLASGSRAKGNLALVEKRFLGDQQLIQDSTKTWMKLRRREGN